MPAQPEHASLPKLSAILATPGSFESIRRTVRYLCAQTVAGQMELLIICASKADLGLDEGAVRDFWGHRVIESTSFESVAAPNAAGVRAATAPVVVFCEDHAFPDPHWAESLITAHGGPYAVVGPAMHNANPKTLVSRADFLIGYGPWAEPIDACEPEHLPGHNSAYKRDILLGYNHRLEDILDAESVLHWDLRREGHRLYLDPSARVAHTNFATFSAWTPVQFHAGRAFAGTRAINWPMARRLLYVCASPLIPIVRFFRIWEHARRLGRSQRMGPAFALVLAWGLTFNAFGEMIGYLAGVGRSNSMGHEFGRVRYITEQDREQLTQSERAGRSSTTQVSLSIVIPAFNSARELVESLPALTAAASPGDEIVVVDDASTDETARVASALGARILSLPRNAGPAAARNHGARNAHGDVLLFVDADVVVQADVMDRMRDIFQHEPDVTAVFGSYDARPRAPGIVSRYRNLLHHFVHHQGHREASTFWAGLGAVRRTAFCEVGGFDAARYPGSSIEDIELGYRLRGAGHRIRLDPAVQGTHLKAWTLWSMIRTDVVGRALPWARLTFQSGQVSQDLNLRADQRWSALLVGLAVVAGVIAPMRSELWALALVALAGVPVLNRRFYALLWREGGLPLVLAGVPLHWLYFFYSGLTFSFAWAEWRLRGVALPKGI